MKRKLALPILFTGVISIAGCGGASFLPNSQTSTVAAVSVACTPSSISTGGATQCQAVVTGSGAYSSDVMWTADIGTISSSGLYTAPATSASGSATVTVTATSKQDKNKFGRGVLSFGNGRNTSAVSGVSVVAKPSSLTMGESANCDAAVSGSGNYSSAVSWTATGGTITQSGIFTPSGPGSGTCTAYSTQDTTKFGTAIINTASVPLSAIVTGVSVTATPSSINMAQTSTCSANVIGTSSYSDAVTWSATGGTITSGGVFIPSGVGTGTCTATSAQDSTKSATASIGISAAPISVTVTGIAVIANPSSINTSQTATCLANVSGTGAFSKNVTWSATGGTITSGGVFTPSGVGTGTCTATSTQDSTKYATASIGISAAPISGTVTGLAVIANPSSINTSQTATCLANVSGTGAFSNNVTWSATGGTITSSGVFTPSGVGTGTCTATSAQSGYSNVSGQATINVTGSGTATLNVNATTIAFGTVNLNTPATQSVTLTSTGTTTVTISGASVTGTGFSISGATFPLTLNPNQSAQLFVVFDPNVAGSATGQLKISSNSSSGATTVVSLTGSGQSILYQVNLSWNAPASSPDPVTGYNVLRAPTGTTTYQQLNTSTVTATNYVDGSVQNGTTYDYVVQSVDAAGTSSAPSNTYTAAIPQ